VSIDLVANFVLRVILALILTRVFSLDESLAVGPLLFVVTIIAMPILLPLFLTDISVIY
jgi:hypothetical protein